ncbi:MAG: DUF1836 domain-containing protein [Clostridiales Family XIII bacterium]|jgi:hypothetical protein|nr:DUF1836 domain-containing protein [Clostridiales Family XIII bacterium]
MIRYEEYIRKFSEEFAENSMIEPEDFPNMDLYADQAAELISEKLAIYGKEKLLTKAMVNQFVKKGFLSTTDKKRFGRNELVLLELILVLRTTYNEDDMARILKPFVENLDSPYDENIDFYELYKKFLTVYKEQRHEAAERTIGRIDEMKGIIRKLNAEDDDDALEILLVLLSIAIEVDTAMYIGKRLLRACYEEPPKERKKEAKKATKAVKKAVKPVVKASAEKNKE